MRPETNENLGLEYSLKTEIKSNNDVLNLVMKEYERLPVFKLTINAAAKQLRKK